MTVTPARAANIIYVMSATVLAIRALQLSVLNAFRAALPVNAHAAKHVLSLRKETANHSAVTVARVAAVVAT